MDRDGSNWPATERTSAAQSIKSRDDRGRYLKECLIFCSKHLVNAGRKPLRIKIFTTVQGYFEAVFLFKCI
jgi:hypothetical protein